MSKRVVVVGGGVIGLNVAFACQNKGMQVLVLEREPTSGHAGCPPEGCSAGNAGMVVPSHFIPLAAPGMMALGLRWMWNPESPFYVRPRMSWALLEWGWWFWRAANRGQVARAAPLLRDLHMASRRWYVELAEQGMDFGLQQRGLLMLCKSQLALEEEAKVAEQARNLGIPSEILDAQQLARLEPGIRMDVAGGVFFPKDCHLHPERFCEQVRRRFLEMGGEYRPATHVGHWETVGCTLRRLETNHGRIEADEFVVCGGAWSAEILSGIQVHLPMQAGKGYSLTLAHPRQMPAICSILTEARVAVTPMGQSLRVGGTMEIAGLNHQVDPRRVRGIVRSVPRYFPELRESDFDSIVPWHGLRPCSPDGLPYLGRTRRWVNLSIATGHAMMGLSLAPITGALVAQWLSGEQPAIDLSLLSPDRFGRHKKVEVSGTNV